MMLAPGLNNFAAMADNNGNMPIIVKSGAIKAFNQWFNKRMDACYGLYDEYYWLYVELGYVEQ